MPPLCKYQCCSRGDRPWIALLHLPMTLGPANFYVEVHGNYETPLAITWERRVPTVKRLRGRPSFFLELLFRILYAEPSSYLLILMSFVCNAEVSSTSSSLRKQADPSHLEALKAIPERDAPTLLGYYPSYKGVLTKRKKREEESAAGQPQRRRPKRKSAQQWFGEEQGGEMLRRGTKRRNIDDEPPASGPKEAPSVSSSQKERRQKTAPEVVIAVQARSVTVQPSATDATGSGGTIQPVELTVEGPREGRFSPSFVHRGSRVLMLEDSVKAEPDLASTLLYGLALPKDMEQLPRETMPSFKEMCSYLVQAGQAALNTSASLTQMAAERARYHDEVKEGRTKLKAFEKQQARDKNKIQQLQNDLLISNSRVGQYQLKMKEMEEAEAKKLAEADAKAYQEGMDRASLLYERDARRMVNRHLGKRLGSCSNPS